jgi:hypothetical protein
MAAGGSVSVTGGDFLAALPRTAYKNQVGPTCGLYALRNAMRYHYNALASQGASAEECLRRAPQLAARKLEQRGAVSDTHGEDKAGLWVPEGMSLREVAKRGHLTGVGELLSGDCIVKLARKLGYQARCNHYVGQGYSAAIRSAVHRGIPPIVVFDVSHGGPTQAQGAHGHWIIAVGWQKFSTAGNTCNVVYVMHWGKFYAFPLHDLKTSAQQLERFPAGSLAKQNHGWDWVPRHIDLNARAIVPQGTNYVKHGLFGGRTGLALTDVTHTLRGVIVEIESAPAPANTLTPLVRREIDEYNANMDHWYRRPSAQSKAAAIHLDRLLGAGIGLTELLDAVLYYTTPHNSRNPNHGANLGAKLKPSSTLCSQLTKALHRWCSA